jgi:hypothetical protein
MARFRLKAGYDEKQLGEVVLKMAEAAGPNNGKLDERQLADFTAQIQTMIDAAANDKFEFVFDTADTIHIVVPFLGKTVYSDNNFANEAMGGIVIRGCGR